MRALIVEDGWQRGVLAATRALATAGWDVGVASPERGFAAFSRHAERHDFAPRPTEPGFTEAVASLVRRHAYDVVFPGGDGELLALSRDRAQISAVLPYAAHDVVQRALDKVALAEAGGRVGLRTADDAGEGPFVVKPRFTSARGVQRIYARFARDRPAAEEAAAELRALGADPVVQAVVEGALGALVAVADREGRLVGAFQQEAEAIWPTPLGGSVRARTVPLDPVLRQRVGALLAELGWFGLAQIQFQVPARGEPVLIDLNGRFYGSLALAQAAGLNLPAMWGALALGREVGPAPEARVGVRYHWLEADVERTRGAPGTLVYALRSTHGVWSPRDPALGARHALRLALRATRRLQRRS